VAYLWKPVVAGKPEGDWYLIEARGVMYGVVKSKLLSRKPNFWGYMDKYFDYSENVAVEEVAGIAETETLGSRVLKNGCEGNDVKEMQSGLIRLGYDLGRWGADGDFGDQTEMAVKQFQSDHGLTVNGMFDEKCVAALDAALVAISLPVEDPQSVVIEGGDCYIRSEAETNGKILGVAKRGSVHAYAGETSQTGWICIKHGGGIGWVSGKYGRLK
jgi:peptidoglycan hydrolase-like protein with peptidoglycan-binding domain